MAKETSDSTINLSILDFKWKQLLEDYDKPLVYKSIHIGF